MSHKKIITVAILSALVLVSCGKSSKAAKPAQLDEDFKKTVQITQDGKEYSAEFTRAAPAIWECRFTYPETIEGMTVTISDGSCKIDFMDLTYSLPQEDLPESSMISLLTGSIDALIAGRDVTCTESEGTVSEKGIISGQDFTAQIKNNEIVSIEVAQNLSAQFQ